MTSTIIFVGVSVTAVTLSYNIAREDGYYNLLYKLGLIIVLIFVTAACLSLLYIGTGENIYVNLVYYLLILGTNGMLFHFFILLIEGKYSSAAKEEKEFFP
jgi:hypothetical protein